MRLALGGDLVPDAVNVSGGAVAEEVRPGIDLVEKLGRVFTAFAGAVPVQLDVEVRGEITAHDVSIWELAALKGLFTDVTEDPVTYVNAPLIARERGCESRLVTEAVAEDFRNVTTLHGTLADGTTVSIAGTLTGPKMVQKLIGVQGYDLEIPISKHLAFFAYEDRPGVIGAVGRLLGDANVNIAGMQVSRDDAHGKALVDPHPRQRHPRRRRHAPSRRRSAPRPSASSTSTDPARPGRSGRVSAPPTGRAGRRAPRRGTPSGGPWRAGRSRGPASPRPRRGGGARRRRTGRG